MDPRARWGGILGALLLGCSNGSSGPAPVGDAQADAIVADAHPIVDGNPFAFDAPSCSMALKPGMPCSMGNMQCNAPQDCESCVGGYVRRSATCTCGGGFWNCDECATCGSCEAGTVYRDPACTIETPADAGRDS